MTQRLEGRTAVVTGAARGIGFGIASRFVKEGCAVALVDVDDVALREAGASLQSFGARTHLIHADVGNRLEVDRMIEEAINEFGRLDILVNNAFALGPMGPVETKDSADFDLALRVCFYATLWAMQAAFPHMSARGSGRIINLVSLAGVDAHPFEADYNAAKEAVRAITRSAAREWAQKGVLVNAIAPFAASSAFLRVQQSRPDAAAKLVSQVPVGRMGDPEDDIAPVALFLASDECRYVTGNVIYADGGAHINGVQWQ
jgi:NAD(P)-dependent dehydrogenase (short-subunit alcohol dehydrogenase family)